MPSVSPSSLGTSHSVATQAAAAASAPSARPCRWPATCRTSAKAMNCGWNNGAPSSSSDKPAASPICVYAPIAAPNQAKTAAV